MIEKMIYQFGGYDKEIWDHAYNFLKEEIEEGEEVEDQSVREYIRFDEELTLEHWKNCWERNDIFEDTIMIGTVGLWHGSYDGCAYLENYQDFLNKIADYDTVRINRKGNKLLVELCHHDGTHYMEIRRLNSKGNEVLANQYKENYEDYIKERLQTFLKGYTKNFFTNKNCHLDEWVA